MMERQLAEKASELKESFLSFYRADFFFLQLTVLSVYGRATRLSSCNAVFRMHKTTSWEDTATAGKTVIMISSSVLIKFSLKASISYVLNFILMF